MHWIVHPGLRQGVYEFLEFERRQVGATAEVLAEKSAVGTKTAPPPPSPGKKGAGDSGSGEGDGDGSME